MFTEVKTIEGDNPDSGVLEEAASLILGGKVLVCPTDTGYAFTANGLDTDAIQKIFALKKRPLHNPIHVALSGIEEVEKYAYVDEAAKVLAREFLPGGLTLVLYRKEIVPSLLTGGRDTIGIRIPDNQAILALARMAGCPLTATSANISGRPTPYTVKEIIEQLGDSISQVAVILDQGTISSGGVSTIVDLTVNPPLILRQGCIGESEIWAVLRSIEGFMEEGQPLRNEAFRKTPT